MGTQRHAPSSTSLDVGVSGAGNLEEGVDGGESGHAVVVVEVGKLEQEDELLYLHTVRMPVDGDALAVERLGDGHRRAASGQHIVKKATLKTSPSGLPAAMSLSL